jgi:hypothetical protein
MTDEVISTSTQEVAGSYDDNPNVTQPIVQPDAAQSDEMPWLLRDKFKGETLEEQIRNQAMAYPELQGKMGKWWGAPKEGDYDFDALKDYGMSGEDPIIKGMKETFKEMGLSNEAIKKLAASYDDSLKGMARSMEESLQKSMTPDLVQQAKRVDQYLSKFTKEEQETFKGWLQTPEDFQRFNTLIAMNPNGPVSNNIPTQGSNYGFKYESSSAVENEKKTNFQRYNKDMSYRSELSQRYKDALIREGKG